jgi:hypothetical protein
VFTATPATNRPRAVFDRLWLVLALLSGAEAWAQARAGKTRPRIRRRFGVDLVWLLVATACPVA